MPGTWLPSTAATRLLGIRHPIVQAPMAGGWTTPELVAAVANTGALVVAAATEELVRDGGRLLGALSRSGTGAMPAEAVGTMSWIFA